VEWMIVVGLTVHLLAVNLACAGPLVCIWLHRRGGYSDFRDRLGKSLAWLSLAALMLGMLTGGLLVLVAPTQGLEDAIGRFPARAFWMAGIELVFSLVCLLIYAIAWKPLGKGWLRWLHTLISLLGTSNLLYHFPPLMVVLGKLAVDPLWTKTAIIDRPAFLELMFRGDVLSLTTHFGLASMAVAAITVLLLLSRLPADAIEEPSAKKIASGAAAVALLSSVLQIPVGIWVLATATGTERNALTGGDPLTSLLFIGGMLLTFLFLQCLTAVAMGQFDSGSLRRVGLLLVVLILLMTATLRGSRRGRDSIKTAATCYSKRSNWSRTNSSSNKSSKTKGTPCGTVGPAEENARSTLLVSCRES